MLSKSLLKRRELILGLGGAGFLASSIFRESFVSAQAAQFPTRFVVLYFPGGVYYPSKDLPYGNHSFDAALKPFVPLQSELLTIKGMNNNAASRMWSASNEPHGAGMRGLLTGDSSIIDEPGIFEGGAGLAKWAKTDTIDQTIAAAIGNGVKFPSLQFGVYSDFGAQIDQRRLIIKGGLAQPGVDSPATMFSRLFSDGTPAPAPTPTATGTMTAPLPPVMADNSARKRSILDRLLVEVAAIKAAAGPDEQAKLNEHLESLRAIEQRIPMTMTGGTITPPVGTGPGTPVPGVGCMTPSIGAASQEIPVIMDQQFELLYQSLVCDLSRVSSFQILCSAQSGLPFTWLGAKDDHHTLEHGGIGATDTIKVDNYIQGEMAKFVTRLKDTKEGGGTLLDNTLVLMISELSDAEQHSHENILCMTAGKAGGRVRPGRAVDYQGASHNAGLLSILQAFGINKNAIGDANLNGNSPISLA
ncbi:MAG: DUF1552 domain-containing protein [Polyangiaceae bacterium]|nr:DUF1552 domain-containing protein [Polyangiaceae bacterium]